jgi:hypothetical protein
MAVIKEITGQVNTPEGYGDFIQEILSDIKTSLYPRYVKVSGNFIPDWLIEIQPGKASSSNFVKKVIKPKVYVMLNNGYMYGIDISSGKGFKVNDPSVFRKGALQSFLSSDAGMIISGLIAGGIIGLAVRGFLSIVKRDE